MTYKRISASVSESDESYIRNQIKKGNFASISDVMRTAIRYLKKEHGDVN